METSEGNKIRNAAIFVSAVLALLVLAGCSSSQKSGCTTKDCFISAANQCSDSTLTLAEDAGTFTYSSSGGCVFTKTLVTPNANETQEMKNLLTGKSLTCKYEKGKFDQRWVNSLILGLENCQGDLKDTLGELMAFA